MLPIPPPSSPSLPSVNQEIKVLCDFLATRNGESIDLAQPLSLAMTNIVSFICFNFSFKKGDPALQAIVNFNDGILDAVGKEILYDMFPGIRVRIRLGPTVGISADPDSIPSFSFLYGSVPDPPFY